MAQLSKSQKRKKSKWINHDKPLLIDIKKFRTVIRNAMAFQSQPTATTFPELPRVVIWMRCLIAVVYGTVLGVRNIRGSIMILNAINIITFIPYVYCRFYLNAQTESYIHNNQQLIFVGSVPAIALSVLIWIYYFTLHHEMEIELLSKFLLEGNNGGDGTGILNTTLPLTVVDTTNVEEVVAASPLLSGFMDDSEF